MLATTLLLLVLASPPAAPRGDTLEPAPDPARLVAAETPLAARPAARDSVIPFYWRTRAERTGYRQTANYEETMRYCRQIEGASRWVKVTSYGVSPQGRDLPLVILSKDRAFTPAAARATGKPVILIHNGIHSGEIEGKDASLALMRDIAALRTREELLDHAILLVLPIFSVDAHERRGRYNRINQNGPEEMGWRSTSVGLNLNRDYLKVETAEMRALISQVYTKWWPELLVDNHTTDGADYRHDVTYAFNHGPGQPPSLQRWFAEAFEGRVVPRLAELGHLPAPYLSFRRGADPASGLDFGDSPPRFSNGYPQLQCRGALLVETHMLKPYETRVRATYDLMLALLEEINARPAALAQAVADAESATVARGRSTDPGQRIVALNSRTSDRSVPFAYKGKVTRWEMSDITGARVPRYSDAPWDTILPLYRDQVAGLVVVQPAGYLIPQEWTVCRDRLDIHGVRYRRLAKAWTDTVEVQHVLQWSAAAAQFEGHHPLSVSRDTLERRVRSFRPGDLWVPLDQRSAMVAVQLFESRAPDGLTWWNYFDTVLLKKEYSEDYVMEPLARLMMADDPALSREFRARLAADSSFAADPQARIDFFYRRSPWADPEQDRLPVVRALRPVPESVLAPEAAAAPAPRN